MKKTTTRFLIFTCLISLGLIYFSCSKKEDFLATEQQVNQLQLYKKTGPDLISVINSNKGQIQQNLEILATALLTISQDPNFAELTRETVHKLVLSGEERDYEVTLERLIGVCDTSSKVASILPQTQPGQHPKLCKKIYQDFLNLGGSQTDANKIPSILSEFTIDGIRFKPILYIPQLDSNHTPAVQQTLLPEAISIDNIAYSSVPQTPVYLFSNGTLSTTTVNNYNVSSHYTWLIALRPVLGAGNFIEDENTILKFWARCGCETDPARPGASVCSPNAALVVRCGRTGLFNNLCPNCPTNSDGGPPITN